MGKGTDDVEAAPSSSGATTPARTGALTELRLLAGDTVRLWRASYPRLLLWFCIGFGVHQLGTQGSALLGVQHQVASTLLFVLGVLGYLGALVMMIHELKPSLWTPGHADRDAVARLVPQPVFGTERGVDVLTLALAPFLAVYSVWGLVEDEVSTLLFANISRTGLNDATTWSISYAPERLGFYAVLTVAAWAIGKAVVLLRTQVAALRERPAPALTLRAVAIVADGTAVFGLFVALAIGATQLLTWWRGREASVWLGQAWRGFLDLLPAVQLWFGMSLPDAVREAATWFWSTLLPAASERVLLPLMWLALTATVYGWREFRGRDIAAGTRLEAVAGRFDTSMAGVRLRSGAVPTVLVLATDDLRTKYLPVANALRLIWHAGPRFIGVYLVAATVLWAGEVWADEGLVRLIGPQSEAMVFVLEPFLDLLLGAVFTTAAVALYATAFDRAVAGVTGTPWRPVPVRRPRRGSASGQGASRIVEPS